MNPYKSYIGRGKKLSIAKAALVVLYETEYNYEFLYSGDIEIMHDIIDVAGANHASMFTMPAVMNCIRNSPYWIRQGRLKSWGNRYTGCYEPSQKGKEYYENNLKGKGYYEQFKKKRNT